MAQKGLLLLVILFAIIIRTVTVHKPFNNYFFKKWTPEMAYVLGYTFADGSIYKNPNGYHYLEYTSTDLDLIKNIKKLFKIKNKIGIRNRQLENPNYKTSYRLQIYAKGFVKDIFKLGITSNKSLTAKFPNIPKSCLGHFIRGYFDGDGGVILGRYWIKNRGKFGWVFESRFTSGSRDFLVGLKKTLLDLTRGGFIRNKTKRSGYDLIFSRLDSLALYRLMYKNARPNTFLKRKFKTFQKAFKVLNYNIKRA